MYLKGTGTTKNNSKAAYWFKQAANQEDAGAQNSLANMYYYGDGVEQDDAKAYALYKKSAMNGLEEGRENFMLQWLENQGVTNTEGTASKKLRQELDTLLKNLQKSGTEKLGNGAYMTTFTSVGKDILSGASYAKEIIDFYLDNYTQGDEAKDRHILAGLLEEMMDVYEATHSDMEGYGVGTMRDVINGLEKKD